MSRKHLPPMALQHSVERSPSCQLKVTVRKALGNAEP